MKLPRLRVTEDKRSLVTADGKPFFYLGDTAWELFHRLTLEEARVYLEDRASKGFNVIQAVALAELDGVNTPTPDGHLPLEAGDVAKPVEAYWAHVDRVVEMANDLGLYIAMLPTWGDKWQKRWGLGPVVFNLENARQFGKWIGERYAGNGIIWVLGGDRPLTNDLEVNIIRRMAEGLEEGDEGTHLKTFHPPGGQSSSKFVHAEPWLDFHMVQTGHDRSRASFQLLAHDWELQPVHPFVNGEPPYEAHPDAFKGGCMGWLNHDDVRRELYWAICDGAAGFTYGVHAIWQFYDQRYQPINGPRATWRESLDLPGSRQVRIGSALALSRPFLDREPASLHLKPIHGLPVTATPRACRGKDGSWAFIYLPLGQSLGMDLSALINGTPRVTWVNPRTGMGHSGSLPDARSMNDVTFVPPYATDGSDWILVLDAISSNYPAITNLLDQHKT